MLRYSHILQILFLFFALLSCRTKKQTENSLLINSVKTESVKAKTSQKHIESDERSWLMSIDSSESVVIEYADTPTSSVLPPLYKGARRITINKKHSTSNAGRKENKQQVEEQEETEKNAYAEDTRKQDKLRIRSSSFSLPWYVYIISICAIVLFLLYKRT